MKDPAKKPQRASRATAEEKLDEEIEESFPASDPPAEHADLRRRAGAAADERGGKGQAPGAR